DSIVTSLSILTGCKPLHEVLVQLDANRRQISVQLVPGAQVSPASHRFAQGLSGGHKSGRSSRIGDAVGCARDEQSWQSDGARWVASIASSIQAHTRVYSTRCLMLVSVCSCSCCSWLGHFCCTAASCSFELLHGSKDRAGSSGRNRPPGSGRFGSRGSSHLLSCTLRFVSFMPAGCRAEVVSDSEETGCGQRFGQLVKIAAVLGESVTQEHQLLAPVREMVSEGFGLLRDLGTAGPAGLRDLRDCGPRDCGTSGLLNLGTVAQQSSMLLGPLTPRSKKYQTANATVGQPHRGRFFSDGEMAGGLLMDRTAGSGASGRVWAGRKREQPTSSGGHLRLSFHQQQQQYAVLSVSTEAVQLSHSIARRPRLPPIRKAASTTVRTRRMGTRLLHSPKMAEGKNLFKSLAREASGLVALARCCGCLNGLKSSVWSGRPGRVTSQNFDLSCPRRQF
uniref:Kinesin motor domain-containing protein n=1 Tax=Macrostomum lignano TaxID=282301 RepID=A0A1I8F9U1_9PLAT